MFRYQFTRNLVSLCNKNMGMVQRRFKYSQKIMDHFNKPRNVGSFNISDKSVGTGLVGAPSCGDVLKIQLKIDTNGLIIDSCFKTFGCATAIASSSYVSELVKNKTIEEAEKIENKNIRNELCLPPVKVHCSLLAADGLQKAIQDWKNKQKG